MRPQLDNIARARKKALGGGARSDRVDWIARMGWFKENPAARRTILAVNLVGVAYGFYYYVPQFAVTPWYLWIFVPDSPLAVLWATLALGLYEFGRRRSDLVDGLAVLANVQVGLWTGYVLVAYAGHFGTFDFSGGVDLNFILLWGHLGMAVEALIFLDGLRASFRARPGRFAPTLGALAAWVLLNDALDYLATGLGTGDGCALRPYTVPCLLNGPEQTLTAVTFGLSLAGLAFLGATTRWSATAGASATRE